MAERFHPFSSSFAPSKLAQTYSHETKDMMHPMSLDETTLLSLSQDLRPRYSAQLILSRLDFILSFQILKVGTHEKGPSPPAPFPHLWIEEGWGTFIAQDLERLGDGSHVHAPISFHAVGGGVG